MRNVTRRSMRGQALVEFAMIFPFFIVLLFLFEGAVEVVQAQTRFQQIVQDAVRAGVDQERFTDAQEVANNRITSLAQDFNLGSIGLNDASCGSTGGSTCVGFTADGGTWEDQQFDGPPGPGQTTDSPVYFTGTGAYVYTLPIPWVRFENGVLTGSSGLSFGYRTSYRARAVARRDRAACGARRSRRTGRPPYTGCPCTTVARPQLPPARCGRRSSSSPASCCPSSFSPGCSPSTQWCCTAIARPCCTRPSSSPRTPPTR
jgi:Flp pilus assembly protein TadG